jgi:hypothetical protein
VWSGSVGGYGLSISNAAGNGLYVTTGSTVAVEASASSYGVRASATGIGVKGAGELGEGVVGRTEAAGAAGGWFENTGGSDHLQAGSGSPKPFRVDSNGRLVVGVSGASAFNATSFTKQSGAPGTLATVEVMNGATRGEAGWFRLTNAANPEPVVTLVGSNSDFLRCERSGTKCRIDKKGIFYFSPQLSPSVCDSSSAGGFYYNKSLNEMCFCNSTAWIQVDGGGSCP